MTRWTLKFSGDVLLLPHAVCKFCLFSERQTYRRRTNSNIWSKYLALSFKFFHAEWPRFQGALSRNDAWTPQPLITDILSLEQGRGQDSVGSVPTLPSSHAYWLSLSPGGLAVWVSVPLPANFPLKKAKVNWAHTARWMPGFALPGANYGTTLDKSQHMLWKALRITAWQFLTMCSCNSCQRQCWKMSNMLIYVYQICPVLYAGADPALWVETGWGAPRKEGNSLISRSAWKAWLKPAAAVTFWGPLEKNCQGDIWFFLQQWQEWSPNLLRWWSCRGHLLYAPWPLDGAENEAGTLNSCWKRGFSWSNHFGFSVIIVGAFS